MSFVTILKYVHAPLTTSPIKRQGSVCLHLKWWDYVTIATNRVSGSDIGWLPRQGYKGEQQLPPLVYLLLELWAVMWAVWSLRLPGCKATQTSSSGEPLRLPERVQCLHPLTATAHAPPPVPLPAMARLQPYWRHKPDPLAESSQNFWPRETVRNNKMVVTVWSHYGFEATFCTTITNQNLLAYKK